MLLAARKRGNNQHEKRRSINMTCVDDRSKANNRFGKQVAITPGGQDQGKILKARRDIRLIETKKRRINNTCLQ